MKQYLIDELRPPDHEKIKAHLDANFRPESLGGIYWIPIGKGLLRGIQEEHVGCQPHYFAVDLEEDRLSCEFLVRTRNRMRCDCIRYANQKQRNWIIRFIDDLLDELAVIT